MLKNASTVRSEKFHALKQRLQKNGQAAGVQNIAQTKQTTTF